jgi:hypothetical protein
MHICRLQVALVICVILVAGLMPGIAHSENGAAKKTVIILAVGGVRTTISEAAIEKRVRGMTGAQARKATIIILVDGAIVREAPASSYRDFVLNADRNRLISTIYHAIPLIESYNADNIPAGSHDPDAAVSRTDSGYSGMTIAALTRYDATLPKQVVLVRASRWSYCVQSSLYGQTAFKNGPEAKVALGHC